MPTAVGDAASTPSVAIFTQSVAPRTGSPALVASRPLTVAALP